MAENKSETQKLKEEMGRIKADITALKEATILLTDSTKCQFDEIIEVVNAHTKALNLLIDKVIQDSEDSD